MGMRALRLTRHHWLQRLARWHLLALLFLLVAVIGELGVWELAQALKP
jgi:hypothetical protein